MTAKAATKQSVKRATQSRPPSKAQTKKTAGPSVPVLVPEVHVRHLQVPQFGHVPVPHVHVPMPDAVRSRLPDPVGNRLVWYGGLAGLAAFGVIGWPVAGVVAAGTYVAEHRAKAARHEESSEEEDSGSTSAPGGGA